MPSYVPNTARQQQEMLATLGVSSMDELLAAIPEAVRLHRLLDLPPAMNEPVLQRHLTQLANRNGDLDHYLSFLGAGTYDRLIPSVVAHLGKRSEFYTAYTPYQPEVSQGMLQATYEFQTLVCQLTGMDAANASLYDGSTSAVEAALLAYRHTERNEVLVARTVDPQYRQTLATYAWTRGYTLREVPMEAGATSPDALRAAMSDQTAAVVIQHPNFFGNLEDMQALESVIHAHGALFISVVTEPSSFAVLATPASYNADVVAAEGMSFGTPPSYGGPALGLFAAKKEYLKLMPGRLVGETVDDRGQRGFVLTLQTREQHIRRGRATSNICTNQALLALFATIYLSSIGKEGFKEVGRQCVYRSHYAFDAITAIPGIRPLFAQPFYDEFVVQLPKPAQEVNAALLRHGIIGGYDASKDYPELENALLVCVTEARTRDEIDRFASALKEVVK